jgi:hypothetical protein
VAVALTEVHTVVVIAEVTSVVVDKKMICFESGYEKWMRS